MMRRIADVGCEFVEPYALLARLDQRDGLSHRDPVTADLVGLAAQAGPEAGGARLGAVAVELDMASRRLGRRAGQLGLQ